MNLRIILVSEGSSQKNNLFWLYKILKTGDIEQISGCRRSGKGTIGRSTKGQEETFDGDGYIHYLDGGDDFTRVYLGQNSADCTL